MLWFLQQYPSPVLIEPVMKTNQTEKTYTVPGMSCQHCVMAVSEEVGQVAGVESVDVALETKQVTVRGRDLDDRALRAAIDEAGYEATP
jgi:copper chaperone